MYILQIILQFLDIGIQYYIHADNSMSQAGFRKIVVCENCLYHGNISEFYDAHKYCIDCLCDHACCPICRIGYHAVNISE
jgi:hypothetical protein